MRASSSGRILQPRKKSKARSAQPWAWACPGWRSQRREIAKDPGLRARALRLLARREYSRSELAAKLAAHGDLREIDELLDQLEALGLQSDARVAEQFVRGRAHRFGVARLRRDLHARGIDRDLIASTLERTIASDDTGELARAREVWRRKFGHTPADDREYGRQARFMQARGFSTAVVRRLLSGPED